MTTISPTRVSIYDFLYQDTMPMVPLLADAAQLSIPQARLAMDASLQAIVSALLAYQQRHSGQVVHKKLFGRGAIKDLRHYNSMNFVTMTNALYHRHDITNTLFYDHARVVKASQYIAQQIDTVPSKVQILLTSLCLIALRELAILAEYSQLDDSEIEKWFALQPQFLSPNRFMNCPPSHDLQALDPYWYELTEFEPEHQVPVQDMQLATGRYLKAIGRSPETAQQGRHNDILVFTDMQGIALPHQRWLLQMAKISDIYLSRNRLKIASEPIHPPKPPLVSLGLIGGNDDNTPTTLSEKPIEYEAVTPLWRNPVIVIIILVIGVLGGLATLKYQLQKPDEDLQATTPSSEASIEPRKAQDVAIVRIHDEAKDTDEAAR